MAQVRTIRSLDEAWYKSIEFSPILSISQVQNQPLRLLTSGIPFREASQEAEMKVLQLGGTARAFPCERRSPRCGGTR